MQPVHGLVVWIALAASCSTNGSSGGTGAPPSERMCTQIGCTSAASLTIRAATSALPAGEHVLTIDADGAVTTCTFTLPVGDPGTSPPCTGGGAVQLSVGLESDCKTVREGGVASRVCEPIRDRVRLHATITGTPARLHVTHRAGAQTLLDRTVAPTYKEDRPNGPGCEPVCRAFDATWDL